MTMIMTMKIMKNDDDDDNNDNNNEMTMTKYNNVIIMK